MTLIRRSSTAVPIALVLTLAAGSALAGTTGTEFQTMYTTLLNLSLIHISEPTRPY